MYFLWISKHLEAYCLHTLTEGSWDNLLHYILGNVAGSFSMCLPEVRVSLILNMRRHIVLGWDREESRCVLLNF